MQVPSSYNEASLRAYVVTALGAVATVLGWTPLDLRVENACIDALFMYGASTPEEATDVAKLRLLARVAAWRAVISDVTADYDFSADGASYNRSKVHAQALSSLKQAEADVMAQGYSMYNAYIDPIVYRHDPYAVYSLDDLPTLP